MFGGNIGAEGRDPGVARQLQHGGAHRATRAVDQQALARPHLRHAGEHLVGRHRRQDHAERVHLRHAVGHACQPVLGHAEVFGVGTDGGQVRHAISGLEPHGLRTCRIDDPHHVVARSEGRLVLHVRIHPLADHHVGEGGAGDQNAGPHLAFAGLGQVGDGFQFEVFSAAEGLQCDAGVGHWASPQRVRGALPR